MSNKCFAYCFGNRQRKKREFAPLKSTIAPIELKTLDIQVDDSNVSSVLCFNSAQNLRQNQRISLKPIVMFRNGNLNLCHDPEDFSRIVIRNNTFSPSSISKNTSQSPEFKYNTWKLDGSKQDNNEDVLGFSQIRLSKIRQNLIKLPKLKPVSKNPEGVSNKL